MTRHIWGREHLVSYLAGGLTNEERYELQEQLKVDAELAAQLDELRGLDERLRTLFAAARPPVTLEDRVIRSLRQRGSAAPREWKMPSTWFAIAATFLLVFLFGIASISSLGSNANKTFTSVSGVIDLEGGTRLLNDTDPSATEFDTDINYNVDRRAEVSVPGAVNANEAIGIIRGDSKPQIGLGTGSMASYGYAHHGINYNIGSLADGLEGRLGGRDPNVNNVVTGLSPAGQLTPEANKGRYAPLGFRVEHNQNASEKKIETKSEPNRAATEKHGWAFDAKEAKKDDSPPVDAPRAHLPAPGGFGNSGQGSVTGDPAKVGKIYVVGKDVTDSRVIMRSVGVAPGSPANAPNLPAEPGVTYDARDAFMRPKDGPAQPSAQPAPGFASPPTSIGHTLTIVEGDKAREYAPKPGGSGNSQEKEGKDPLVFQNINRKIGGQDAANGPPPPGEAGESKAGEADTNDTKKLSVPTDEDIRRGKPVSEGGNAPVDVVQLPQLKDNLKDGNVPKKDPAEKIDPKQPEPKQPTQKRVIIRSGDIEFEVESFDAAVGVINTLIGKTKGGVVANTNSEQLPNGKMRGTVVVRMPPEELDDFVASLRRDLGKTGELKKQKIGSQDVSKLYTDMESELRGLRISEERLIVMLKDTKAKLSDLLAVENQLAKTRTRIEQFEGELRFYANLAAMSTLKIELHEKHILTAATIVESERVRAGVESEDVEKAFQDAKAAIAELKGRVFQSEMTQTAIGRYQATLQFEVAPEAAGPMRDRLRQIGVVARLDIDRLQSTEGGGKPSRESRVKRGDTQFEVVIYDLASYTPRETVNATIVSSDVPANYRALRDLVGKVKGTLLGSSLHNNDVRNVVANLEFTVRRSDEGTIQAALGTAGEFLTRAIERAPEAANVTDTKIRYKIVLKSVTSIMARESNKVTVAALDVLASDRALRAVVLKVKGSIRNANLQETDRNNISATLDFDVLREHENEVDVALAAAGEITSRRRDRRPESESVTDAKVNYAITMNSVATLTPRETVNITIAAPDVAVAFASLRETATKNEAQMQTANLTENDRRDINAQLDFAVLRVKDDVINTALAAAGEQLKRQVDRQASGAQLTDAKVQYRVTLRSTNTIEPREIRVLKIKVDRVEEKLKYMKERVKEAQGRIVDGPTVLKHPNGTTEARAKYLVPLSAASLIGDDFRKIGEVTGKDELTNPNAPDGKLALALFDVKLHEADLLVPGDEGFGAQLRNGISISLRGLSIAASFVIAALLFLAPWAIVGWVVLAIMRRRNGRREAAASEAAKT